MAMKTNKSVIEDLYPLSPMQQGMLFHTLYQAGSDAYFEQCRVLLRGQLALPAFKHAWQQLVMRHAVLRTQFVWDDVQHPLQVVRDRLELPWIECDWRAVPGPEQQSQVQEFVEKDRRRRFRLERAPLFRIALLRLADDLTQLVWSYHHLLLDGWSSALLLEELFAFYEAYRQGTSLDLSLPRPYRDYIIWMQDQDQVGAEHFWRQRLAGFRLPTILQVDHAAGSKHRPVLTYERQHLSLSAEETAGLRACARQHQLTLNTLIQGVWALLLSHYSGSQDVVFGAVVAGRPEQLPGSEQMIGLFINTIPVRVRISPRKGVLPWLKDLQVSQLEAQQFAYHSLADIQGWSQVPGTLPLFESLLVFENYPVDGAAFERRLSLGFETADANEHTNYPLALGVLPDNVLELYLTYDPQRFAAQTIRRMLWHLQDLLQIVRVQPLSLIGDLAPLSQREQQEVLQTWNETAVPVVGPCTLPDMYEAQVARTPEAIALVSGDEHLTYHQVNARANALAAVLQQRGVGPDVLVGLCCRRSPRLVMALLAILKAGGAYVPLDPLYPRERLEFLLSDTHLALVLTEEDLQSMFPHCACVSIEICQQDRRNPSRRLQPAHGAYVIYTSGSTGLPKGAVLCHESICGLLQTQVAALGVGMGSRVLQFASLNFDASVWEILTPLTTGGTLYVDTRETLLPGAGMGELVLRQAITLAALTPSVLAALPVVPAPTLGTLIVSGEPCSRELAARWSRGRRLHNAYGPTETTVYSTIEPDLRGESTPGIGRPIANTRIYLLNSHMQPVPVGVSGELWIGGSGLARGYLHRPELTAERFVPDPFRPLPGARMYRTGDLARYTPHGRLEFLGRLDQQLKIRGFRIEPAEIEAALARSPLVQRCVVVGQKHADDWHLVAYVLPAAQQVSVRHLRDYLQERLPAYLLPDTFVLLESFPLTPNGKIDLSALQAAHSQQAEHALPAPPPRDLLETQVIEAYEAVLQVHPISVSDDFFLRGGHSLSAIRLVSEIQKRLNITITLPMLFQTGTVARLAQTIRQMQQAVREQDGPPVLVPLREAGGRRPLFCVHPASGQIICYQALTRYLAPDQPVYGLQDPQAHSGEITSRSVAEIAGAYLSEIRQVQPEGPYQLAGYSFGCVVAFEMAQQLRRAGQDVALLALIDGNSPALAADISTEDAYLLAVILMEWLRGATTQSAREIRLELEPLAPAEQMARALQLLRERQSDLETAGPGWLRHQVQLFKCRLQAVQTYQAEVYDQRITALLSSTERTPERIVAAVDHAHDLGWHHYTRLPIDLHLLPGSHEALMQEPTVQTLATHLQTCLDEVWHSGAAQFSVGGPRP